MNAVLAFSHFVVDATTVINVSVVAVVIVNVVRRIDVVLIAVG
jgi:hypothetical protein